MTTEMHFELYSLAQQTKKMHFCNKGVERKTKDHYQMTIKYIDKINVLFYGIIKIFNPLEFRIFCGYKFV